ncbi:MAG: hypothetical protein ACOYNY_02960 [Caldilineaceae bacterium]
MSGGAALWAQASSTTLPATVRNFTPHPAGWLDFRQTTLVSA